MILKKPEEIQGRIAVQQALVTQTGRCQRRGAIPDESRSPSLGSEGSDVRQGRIARFGCARNRPGAPPDRIGPQGVVAATADDMDVKLGRDIAQGGDVQLVDGRIAQGAQFTHQGAGADDLLAQKGALVGRQVFQLDRAGDSRQQDQPGKAGVVLKPDMAQGPVGGEDGPRLERRIRCEQGH